MEYRRNNLAAAGPNSNKHYWKLINEIRTVILLMVQIQVRYWLLSGWYLIDYWFIEITWFADFNERLIINMALEPDPTESHGFTPDSSDASVGLCVTQMRRRFSIRISHSLRWLSLSVLGKHWKTPTFTTDLQHRTRIHREKKENNGMNGSFRAHIIL